MLLTNRSGAGVSSFEGIERHTTSLQIVKKLFCRVLIVRRFDFQAVAGKSEESDEAANTKKLPTPTTRL